MSETMNTDGSCCMKCGRDWMLHPRWPSKHPACDRGNIEQDAHNAADWIARITQLERDLSEARRERDEARAQLDTYIRTAAEAVAEQGRCEAAGRVLARAFVATSDALTVNAYTDKAYSQEQISARTKNSAAAKDVYESVLAIAWVRQAQEASQS